jgi:hypothetical protein
VPRVVLLDQRLGVGAYHLGDGADVPPRVEVAAALGVVVFLDLPDDRFPDAGLQADLGYGQVGLAPRLRQGFTDRHAMPPLLCRRTHAPAALTARREWVVPVLPCPHARHGIGIPYPNPVKDHPPLE